MDDTPSQENSAPTEPSLNKLDLSQLQSFSFGTQWSQEKVDPRDARRGDDRPRREGGSPERRDRRAFRKPVGEGTPATPGSAEQPPREGGDPRRDFRGAPRREPFRGEQRGGPRRDDSREGGQRFGRGGPVERGPYDSPYFTSTFYPEDTSFTTLAKTIRSSCRTIELFEIARTVVGKPDRFVVVIQRKPSAQPQAAAAAPAAEGQAAAAPVVPGVKAAPLYLSVPDGLPFETEDAAIAHVLQKHLHLFFDTAEVEIEPPKGNYQMVNRCSITGELLAPPNYHRYNQIVQQHFATRINRMPFEVFRSRIESVRDPEVVKQWLEKMKKITRYTWKLGKPAAAAAAPAVAAETPAPVAAPEAAPAVEGQAAVPAPAPESAPAAPAAAPALSFDSLEDARVHLLTQARDKVVRTSESARFHGRLIENLPQGEIRRALEGTLERQRRFPLDTANALRGRLRREGFTIFKKGSKGISYVCAVKRKFRVPGQTFAESINALISYIESNPMVRANELAEKFLGISLPKPEPRKAPAAPEGQPVALVEGAPAPEAAAPSAAAVPAAPAAPELSVEQREKIARMQGDLLWLVREGYVTEFIDSRLFAPPPMVEARKKEVEAEDHDPENFPEVPAEPAPAPAAAEQQPAPVQETPAAEPVPEPAPEAAPETKPEEPKA
jgi:hypothetical protein